MSHLCRTIFATSVVSQCVLFFREIIGNPIRSDPIIISRSIRSRRTGRINPIQIRDANTRSIDARSADPRRGDGRRMDNWQGIFSRVSILASRERAPIAQSRNSRMRCRQPTSQPASTREPRASAKWSSAKISRAPPPSTLPRKARPCRERRIARAAAVQFDRRGGGGDGGDGGGRRRCIASVESSRIRCPNRFSSSSSPASRCDQSRRCCPARANT